MGTASSDIFFDFSRIRKSIKFCQSPSCESRKYLCGSVVVERWSNVIETIVIS